jgi:pyruvate formate lyase activating enzyme
VKKWGNSVIVLLVMSSREAELVTGIVFDIRRFSVHDGPGLRTTVFFKGCPLKCAWCHNPESQARAPELIFWDDRCQRCQACVTACEQGAITLVDDHIFTDPAKCISCGHCTETCYAEARQIAGRKMSVASVMSEVQRDVPFYDQSGGGVTFSGGEPLMQPDYLVALLSACKASDIHTTLDTCGQTNWKTLDRIRSYVDLFLYDLKFMDPGRHKQQTGVTNERILENLKKLSRHGHEIILRVPIIPGANADLENIRAIGSFAASLPSLNRVDILPYHRAAINKYERMHRSYGFNQLLPPSEEEMAEIARLLEEYGLKAKVGG